MIDKKVILVCGTLLGCVGATFAAQSVQTQNADQLRPEIMQVLNDPQIQHEGEMGNTYRTSFLLIPKLESLALTDKDKVQMLIYTLQNNSFSDQYKWSIIGCLTHVYYHLGLDAVVLADGTTVLHYLVQNGYSQYINPFLQQYLDRGNSYMQHKSNVAELIPLDTFPKLAPIINKIDSQGNTALHYAVQNFFSSIANLNGAGSEDALLAMRLLIRAGGDLSIPNHRGVSVNNMLKAINKFQKYAQEVITFVTPLTD